MFGLVTFALTKASRMSMTDLQQITGANLSLEQLEAVYPHLRMFALALALTGVVPGAVFVLCSVGLRRGISAARALAMVLAATQLFVAGAVLLRQVLVGIGNGDPPAITANVLALGTPMALLVFVIRCLFAAPGKPGRDDRADGENEWPPKRLEGSR